MRLGILALPGSFLFFRNSQAATTVRTSLFYVVDGWPPSRFFNHDDGGFLRHLQHSDGSLGTASQLNAFKLSFLGSVRSVRLLFPSSA